MEASNLPQTDLLRKAFGMGWSIFPVREDKKPAFSWKEYQDRQPFGAEIKEWIEKGYPAWAVVTGSVSQIVIIDFDGDAGRDTLNKLGLEAHVRTGSGGYHVYVEHPGYPVKTLNSKSKIELGKRYPGLDIRADGGYAVFCGRNRTGAYAWLRDMVPDSIDVLPSDLREYLMPAEETQSNAPKPNKANLPRSCEKTVNPKTLVSKYLSKSAQVGRNNAGFELACQLRDNGYSSTEAEQPMREYAARVPRFNTKGQPEPYTADDALKSMQQAYLTTARAPWSELQNTSSSSTPAKKHKPSSEKLAHDGQANKTDNINVVTGARSFSLTDYGNAERLVSTYGNDIRYCETYKSWFINDGIRFAEDKTREIERLAKETVRSIYQEAYNAPDDERKRIVKHALASESVARLTAMVTLAESERQVSITEQELDANQWVLNCLNGCVDLHTANLLPHNRTDLFTKVAPVEYDSTQKCPIWLNMLDQILDGNSELIDYVQRALGYSLTGDTREQVLFFLYGTGANGKSTFLNTVRDILGDYAMQTQPETFMAKQGDTGAREDVAQLKGMRFVAAVEAEAERRMAEVLVKQLTGGDVMRARRLYQNSFEFKPTAKLWFAANHKPTIRGNDNGIWRRIKTIPFLVRIPDSEQDKTLADRLKHEYPGILAWMVEGCVKWQREGLGEPEAVREATQEYRTDMDLLGDFLSDCCVIRPGAKVATKQLYTAYEAWCIGNGENPLTNRRFNTRIEERDGIQKRRGSGNKPEFVGIGLVSESSEELPELLEIPSSVNFLHEKNTEKSYPKQPHTVTLVTSAEGVEV